MAPVAALLLILACAPFAPAQPAADLTRIDEMDISGAIDGSNVTFTLAFAIDHAGPRQTHALIRGAVALDSIDSTGSPSLDYQEESATYRIGWGEAGRYKVTASFAARPSDLGGGWRQAQFDVPVSRVRKLKVVADRKDLELTFPGALRQERSVEGDKLTVTAILGPGRPFVVRWRPQVQQLDGELVYSASVNTIATVSSAAVRLDSLFAFEIAQGKLGAVRLLVPEGVSVTQVIGASIRDWRLVPAGDEQHLHVTLSQQQSGRYDLRVIGESVMPTLPTDTAIRPIRPIGDAEVRSSGQLVIGTDSAVRLVPRQVAGLAQIDANAFARRHAAGAARNMPGGTAFYYNFATDDYAMTLRVEDVVPVYDVEQNLVARADEDDLALEAQIGIEVREAPLRWVQLRTPAGFVVAGVGGPMVEDYTVTAAAEGADDGRPTVRVQFREGVLGQTMVQLRLELGRSPLGARQTIGGIEVAGAANQRGHVMAAAAEGVELGVAATDKLREVHTASVKVTAPGVRFAYRIRESDWSLTLDATRKPSGLRAEAFHVVSIGEQMVYGSVTVSYFISGAPIDELRFSIPDKLANVEFIGADVRRWTREGDTYTVKLARKVIGDYNLGVVYSYRYEDGGQVLAGGVEVAEVDTQTGYVVVASHLNLQLKAAGERSPSLIPISREEVPDSYRLLVNAPILATWKYVAAPHLASVSVHAYDRGELIGVVIELQQIHTDLNIDEHNHAESITRVRYKVKNSSAQFLALDVPADATLWYTHLVETDAAGNETKTRIAASYDAAKKLLMIPLPRKRNPNDPTTIDLQYARTHGEVGRRLELTAPRSAVRSTFAGWTVSASEDWALHPTGGNMLAEPIEPRLGGIAPVLGAVGRAWGRSLAAAFSSGAAIWLTLIGAGAVVVTAILARPRTRAVAMILLATAVLLLGVGAAGDRDLWASLRAADRLNSISFSQPLTLGDAEPLRAEVRVTPAWRKHATFLGSIVVPVLGVALLVAGVVKRRFRAAAWAMAAVAFTIAAARFDLIRFESFDLRPPVWIGHVFTWLVPLALAGFVLWRCALRHVRIAPGAGAAPGAATAAGAILLAITASGAHAADLRVVNLTPDRQLNAVEIDLTAERDTMRVSYRLMIDTAEPVSFPLLDTDAVLTTPPTPAEGVRIVAERGLYRVVFDKPGRHDVKLTLLTPLGVAGAEQSREFSMPVPPALSTRAALTLQSTGLSVDAPGAARFAVKEADGKTTASAMFVPGERVRFTWQPRTRQTNLERTVFFADVTSAIRFDVAQATGRHRADLQIAQGEIDTVRLAIPEGMTVTAVEGASMGAWRFDPATRELEVRLTRAVSGTYSLAFVTQTTGGRLPWPAAPRSPIVAGASRQIGAIGLLTTPDVFVEVRSHPQEMNGEDFARLAGALIAAFPGAAAGDVRQAYRTRAEDDTVSLTVNEVRPELRSAQNAAFSVEDTRLALNSVLSVKVHKAGVFSVQLLLPGDYEIDALHAPQVSHWDEDDAGDGKRRVTVHFTQKTIGEVPLRIALSQSVTDLPPRIDIPRIELVGSVKHSGQLVVRGERGLRLTVAERGAVSELNPAQLDVHDPGALAFRLLEPAWVLALAAEVLEPRITCEFLHLAEVSDALVRHHHHVRYHMANAGAKVFDLIVPTDALGLVITGPDIANTKLIDAGKGLWRVELARKYFDQPLPLTLRYETRFDMDAGEVGFKPVRPLGADLYRGHVVVRATDKVELSAKTIDAALQAAESRTIGQQFPASAQDLADAAFTYATPTPDVSLVFAAERHGDADQLGAEVRSAIVATVVNERGQSINSIVLDMRVGAKRHLHVRLPAGAAIWSLMVNGRSVVPSETTDAKGQPITLIPLAQAAGDELDVGVELTYVLDRPADWRTRRQRHVGPQFDLPMKNVRWVFFLPTGYDYGDFAGTLTVDEQSLREDAPLRYDLSVYQQQVVHRVRQDNQRAMEQISIGNSFAAEGKQQQAKAALWSAYNYSRNDTALNEDARVQLHRLNREQAMVGLKSRRNTLRPGSAADDGDLGGNYSQAEAQRELSQLDRTDSDNLERIATRLIEAQERAAGESVGLTVQLPYRGRVIAFNRPLQVEPDSPMHIQMAAVPQRSPRTFQSWTAACGLFVGLFALLALAPRLTRANRAEA